MRDATEKGKVEEGDLRKHPHGNEARPTAEAGDRHRHARGRQAHEVTEEPQVALAPVVAIRESSVTTLGRLGVLNGDQIAAAFRFRNAFEIVVDAKRASLGFQEWQDPGKPSQTLLERRSRATDDLRKARALLGAHGYSLVGRICGEGYCIADLFQTRRERDTHIDMLKIHLASLASLWK